MESILHAVVSFHSMVNFKIHTQENPSRCKERSISQVIASEDLKNSDVFFDSIPHR
jgi:hypothetical protein